VFIASVGCSKDKTPGKTKKYISPPVPGMLYIPEGEAVIGTNPKEEASVPNSAGFARIPYTSEVPKRTVLVHGFYIDIHEVTFRQFKKFLDKTKHPLPAAWQEGINYEPLLDYPVTGVSWNDANAFAKWAGKRLPTEVEWEKAARGSNGSRYVFGNKFDQKKAGIEHKTMVPVTETSLDKSIYGVIGMSGNVSEWTASWYKAYPGSTETENAFGEKYRVFRGGTWVLSGGHRLFPEYYFRPAFRGYSPPNEGLADVGFRCAKDVP